MPRSSSDLMDEILALRDKQKLQAQLALGSRDTTKSFDPAGNAKLVDAISGQNGLGGLSQGAGTTSPGARTPFGQDIDKFFAPAKDAVEGFLKPVNQGLKNFGQSINSGFNSMLPDYLTPQSGAGTTPSHINDKEAALLGNPPSVQSPGVYGDTKIADLTPYQQLLLMLRGGSGRTNPDGLPGFDGGDGDGGDGGDGSDGGADGGWGAGDSGFGGGADFSGAAGADAAGADAGTGTGGAGADYSDGSYDFSGVGNTSDYNYGYSGPSSFSGGQDDFSGQTFGEATGYGASAPGYNSQGTYSAGSPDGSYDYSDYDSAHSIGGKLKNFFLGTGPQKGQMPGWLKAGLALAPGPVGLIAAIGSQFHAKEANRQAGAEFGKGYGELSDDERAAIDSVMADNDAKSNADTDAGGMPLPVIASGYAQAEKYIPRIAPYVAGTPYGALSAASSSGGMYQGLHSDDPYIGLTSNSYSPSSSDNGLAEVARNALNSRVMI